MASQIYADQLTAVLIQEGIEQAEALKESKIAEILQCAIEKEGYARTALSGSMQCIENLRDFTSSPEHILGNTSTKHGEIAEHLEVEIRNGQDILKHIKPSATFEGVGRTAPEDYIIDGVNVQSKYINGAAGRGSLDEVLKHLRDYPKFTENGYYHIPKDQFDVLNRINNSENISGLSGRTIRACQEKIREIEEMTGKPFSEVVKPGISTYNETQLGKVDETIDTYEQKFKAANEEEVKQIRQQRDNDKAQAEHITDPSWGEALKYSAIAAVIGGTTNAGIKIYAKIKAGKKIQEFTIKDWKEVGYDFGKGGLKGGVSGLGIYGLTKIGGMSAPFAGAMVSTAMGLTSLYSDYRKGKISKTEYGDASCALSVEAGLAAVGSAIGQAVIPIPVLGAIIGSVVSKSALEITKYIMGKNEKELIKKMQQEYDELVSKLDKQCREIIDKIDTYFNRLGGLIEAALSPEINKAFVASIELCRFIGVNESDIIHSNKELDDFMLS